MAALFSSLPADLALAVSSFLPAKDLGGSCASSRSGTFQELDTTKAWRPHFEALLRGLLAPDEEETVAQLLRAGSPVAAALPLAYQVLFLGLADEERLSQSIAIIATEKFATGEVSALTLHQGRGRLARSLVAPLLDPELVSVRDIWDEEQQRLRRRALKSKHDQKALAYYGARDRSASSSRRRLGRSASSSWSNSAAAAAAAAPAAAPAPPSPPALSTT